MKDYDKAVQERLMQLGNYDLASIKETTQMMMIQVRDKEWINTNYIIAVVLLAPGEGNDQDSSMENTNTRRLYIDLTCGSTIKVYDQWIDLVMNQLAIKATSSEKRKK